MQLKRPGRHPFSGQVSARRCAGRSAQPPYRLWSLFSRAARRSAWPLDLAHDDGDVIEYLDHDVPPCGRSARHGL